ncbi:DUF3040 domain-containing protein [Streptacidiphilus sp. P02-A3a]|uniref:DUF3040 domain-containing protein n=1 Tax=Streptacidiphilus sp. P02-A3a TaxID=2704468 RepID=UPI0015FD6AEC|nr:DUF3040 domain-containing protein [Streptacidiphilus sp. P02-A3a]QMU71324.1 DUF3040 domain-containing protein [Streptacidiphilus sp. P02-A3a]
MNGPPLSWQEQKILEEIETELRTDRDLDSELSAMRVTPLRRARFALREWGRSRARVVLLLLSVAASLALLGLAVAAPRSVVLVPAVLVWMLTVTTLLNHGVRQRGDQRRKARR